jgi:hypothetical protein
MADVVRQVAHSLLVPPNSGPGVPLPSASFAYMTDINFQEAPAVAERKPRKSVAFSDGDTIMDENGEISEAARGEDRTTAEKHTNGVY